MRLPFLTALFLICFILVALPVFAYTEPDPAKIEYAIINTLISPNGVSTNSFFGSEAPTNKLTVVFELESKETSPFKGYIKGQGATAIYDYENLVQADVPISKITILSEYPNISYVRLPYTSTPSKNNVSSEGLKKIGVENVHSLNYTGENVRIGILSCEGFDINNTEIAENIQELKSFRLGGISNFGVNNHGTGVTEIILDVAPNSILYLSNYRSDVQYQLAIDWLISKNVSIISHSCGWYNTGPPTSDGCGKIGKKTEDAYLQDILFVNSAGNEEDKQHYRGTFTDKDGDTFHDFSRDTNFLQFNATVGDYVMLFLSWMDWPKTFNDYDLYLYDSDFNLLVRSSSVQNGSQSPREGIRWWIAENGSYFVGIKNKSAMNNVVFDLYATHSITFEQHTPGHSLLCPAPRKEVAAVGATYYATDEIESFSSRGPTDDGLKKPEVLGPDGVFMTSYGESKYGTSFSAPHVAGTAALMLQANNTLTPDQIVGVLQKTGKNVYDPILDEYFSRIDAYEAVRYVTNQSKTTNISVGLPYNAPTNDIDDILEDAGTGILQRIYYIIRAVIHRVVNGNLMFSLETRNHVYREYRIRWNLLPDYDNKTEMSSAGVSQLAIGGNDGWNEQKMVEISEGVWETPEGIPLPPTGTIVLYQICGVFENGTRDCMDVESYVPEGETEPIISVDVIGHYPANPTEDDTVMLLATTSGSPTEVIGDWNDGSGWSSLPMSIQENGFYYTDSNIPGRPAGTSVQYKVCADGTCSDMNSYVVQPKPGAILSNFEVRPGHIYIKETAHFLIDYTDPDNKFASLKIYINGNSYPMEADLTNYADGVTFEYTRAFAEAGVYEVYFVASNGRKTTRFPAKSNIPISVSYTNAEPRVTQPLPEIGTLYRDKTTKIFAKGTDTDYLDTIKLSLYMLKPDGELVTEKMKDEGSGYFTHSFTPAINDPFGTYTMLVVGTDGKGSVRSDITTFEVWNNPPEMLFLPNFKNVVQGTTLPIEVQAWDVEGLAENPVDIRMTSPSGVELLYSGKKKANSLFNASALFDDTMETGKWLLNITVRDSDDSTVSTLYYYTVSPAGMDLKQAGRNYLEGNTLQSDYESDAFASALVLKSLPENQQARDFLEHSAFNWDSNHWEGAFESDVTTTSAAIIALNLASSDSKRIKKAVKWLSKEKEIWAVDHWKGSSESDYTATAYALIALDSAGVENKKTIAARDYLLNQYSTDEKGNYYWQGNMESDVSATALVYMALHDSEASQKTEAYLQDKIPNLEHYTGADSESGAEEVSLIINALINKREVGIEPLRKAKLYLESNINLEEGFWNSDKKSKQTVTALAISALDKAEKSDVDLKIDSSANLLGDTFIPSMPFKLIEAVYNDGNYDAKNVEVSFYDGKILIGSTIVDVPANGSALATVDWIKAENGNHTIRVIIDPESDITEYNKSNNKRVKNVYVNGEPVLENVEVLEVYENHMLTLEPKVLDPDNDTITYYASDLFRENLTWTPTFEDAGTYSTLLLITDGHVLVEDNLTVVVHDVNRPPMIETIQDITLSETEQVKVDINAVDSDGDELTITFSEPLNSEGRWNTTYDDAGTYNITISASDGELTASTSFTVTVLDINRPPILDAIQNITVKEGELVRISAAAVDPDNDELVFEYAGTMNSSEWQTTFDDTGVYNVKVTVSDGELSDAQEIAVTVLNVNRPPVVEPMPDVTITETETVQVKPTATDPDNDSLTYSMSEPIGDDGTWNTTYDDAGEYSIIVTASDGSLQDSTSFTLTVLNKNRPPALTPFESIAVNEGETIKISPEANDPDGDALTYTFTGAMEFGEWQTDFEDAGIHTVTVVVSDGELFDEQKVTITILDVNRPPVLEYIEDVIVDEGEIVRIMPIASDPDGNTISLAFSESFDVNGRWNTTYDDSGTYTVTVTASDGALPVSQEVVVTVLNVNRAPVLEYLNNVDVFENETVRIEPNANDPDADNLTFTIVSDAPLVKVDGVWTWVPTFEDAGTYSATIMLSDGSLTDSQTINLAVGNVNRAPLLEPLGDIILEENDTVRIEPKAFDPDGDDVSVSISDPLGNDYVWDTTFEDAGVYAINVVASDGELSVSQELTITVLNVNRPPALEPLHDVIIEESEVAVIEPVASDPDGDELVFYYNGVEGQNSMQSTPDDSGVYVVLVTVSDGELSLSQNVTVIVANVNRPPVLEPINDITVKENEQIILTPSASDPDNENFDEGDDNELIFSIESDVPFEVIESSWVWIPTFEDAGEYSAIITVSDGGFVDSQTVWILVEDVSQLSEPEPTENVTENTTITPINMTNETEKNETLGLPTNNITEETNNTLDTPINNSTKDGNITLDLPANNTSESQNTTLEPLINNTTLELPTNNTTINLPNNSTEEENLTEDLPANNTTDNLPFNNTTANNNINKVSSFIEPPTQEEEPERIDTSKEQVEEKIVPVEEPTENFSSINNKISSLEIDLSSAIGLLDTSNGEAQSLLLEVQELVSKAKKAVQENNREMAEFYAEEARKKLEQISIEPPKRVSKLFRALSNLLKTLF